MLAINDCLEIYKFFQLTIAILAEMRSITRRREEGGGRNQMFELKIPTDANPVQKQ